MKIPCKTDGVDCPNRHVGCQSKCEKYLAFRTELDRINDERRKDTAGADFAAETIWRKRHALKFSPAAKRAISQR